MPDFGTIVWVADHGHNRVVVWTKGDTGWSHSASIGIPVTAALTQTDGQLTNPRDVFVDATGTILWVADTLDSRITVWAV